MTDDPLKKLISALIRLTLVTLVSLAVASCAVHNSLQSIQQQQVWNPPALTRADSAWIDSVHFELYHCNRDLGTDSSYGFYLVGEMHVYNEATSRFADTLLARLQPGLFLSEGSNPKDSATQFNREYGKAMRKLLSGTGYDAPELSHLAKARGIPVVWLEKVDSSTGIYEGITPAEKNDLEFGFNSVLNSNKKMNRQTRKFVKFFLDHSKEIGQVVSAILDSTGLDSAFSQLAESHTSGIIDTRNRIMSMRAAEYLQPENGCVLIRFGMGHSQGMIEDLKKYDCDCEFVPLAEWLRESQ